jgi:hypothetical protein
MLESGSLWENFNKHLMATNLKTWITGDAGAGKTTHLVETFTHWWKHQKSSSGERQSQWMPPAIIFAVNRSTRHHLTQQLTRAIAGESPIVVKTPLGFMEEEVNLFSPLWWEKLNLTPKFPLRLRSETEQDLAMKLWHQAWPQTLIPNARAEARIVRTTLDILQLAAASGTPLEDIPALLASRLSEEEKATFGDEEIFSFMGELIWQWRDWCLDRGLLTYGLIYYLYGQVLLPDATYREHLQRRYRAIFADDVDDYPAIAHDLASLFLQENTTAVFTFNPNGKVRLGLNADPDTWEKLAHHCQHISLSPPPSSSGEYPPEITDQVSHLIQDPSSGLQLPSCIQHLQTISRSQLLRKAAETIIQAIKQGKVASEEVAIIAPGLDEIARYTLIKLFTQHSIPIYPLNEQRPLISSSLVRALFTLACFVYPDLGRLIETNAVAEMLVVLTEHSSHSIDPVRAGLIADYCYQADPSVPRLLDIKTFPRWDRIGYQAEIAYNQLRHWIEQQKNQQTKEKPNNLVGFFNQGIQQFLWKGNNLSVADLVSLRELTETTQHYWEVQRRIQDGTAISQSDQIQDFIQLLRQGTITANPHPLTSLQSSFPQGITLANIFQYRSQRMSHPWQLWLDVGSPLWEKQGAANLFASSVFLRNSSSEEEEEHLQRLITDLLNRAQEKVYLGHSDLAVNGTEQTGILLSLIQGSTSIDSDQLPVTSDQ